MNKNKYLLLEELDNFFSVIDSQRDRPLFLTIYHYGLRVGEATKLDWDDVDFKAKKNTIHRIRRRGDLIRTKELWSGVIDDLKIYVHRFRPKRDQKALFLSREGRISKRMVEILFRRYCSQAGIKLDKGKNVHILRHSRAIHILEKTGNIELVQDVLDHQDLKTTVHMYLRRTKEMPARFRESEKQQAVVTM